MISSQDGTEERLLRAVLRLERPACSATGVADGAGTADAGFAAPFPAVTEAGGWSSRAASAAATRGA